MQSTLRKRAGMQDTHWQIDRSIWEEWDEFDTDENGLEFFQSMVDVFVGAIPGDFSEFLSGVRAQDHERIFHFSHSLKSSCRSIGAMTLGETFETIEITVRRGEKVDVALVDTTVKGMASVIEQLLAARNQKRPRISARARQG